jgi:hypothetical protein
MHTGFWWGNLKEKRSRVRPPHKYVDNIKMNLKRCGRGAWTGFSSRQGQVADCGNEPPRVQDNAGSLLTSWGTVSFSRGTQLHGVSQLISWWNIRTATPLGCVFDGAFTRWFKYDRDYLCVNKPQFVLVIFEPPCILINRKICQSYVNVDKRSVYFRCIGLNLELEIRWPCGWIPTPLVYCHPLLDVFLQNAWTVRLSFSSW